MTEMTDRSPSDGVLLECPICYKKYASRSSYLRHSRKCLERTVSSPRQKSCRQCADAKTRCTQTRPRCSRCTTRKYECSYVSRLQRRREQPDSQTPCTPSSRGSLDFETGVGDNEVDSHGHFECTPTSSNFEASIQDNQALDQVSESFEHAGAVSSALGPDSAFVSHQPIQNSAVGETFEKDLQLPAQISPFRQEELKLRMSFLSRIFRTYPRMMARREQLPPFIHESQISSGNVPLPLSNCFALARMWDGGGSEVSGRHLIESTIRQEMQRLFSEYWNYDAATLIATFQATIIYSLILRFPIPGQPPTNTFDPSLVVSLKELGFHISRQTLILDTESSHTRPSWQDWVLVNCRRRTMMALYCFEWINAMLNDFAAFPCTEIDFMPAPTAKVLWNSPTREKWETAYDRWLGRWAGKGQYTIGELTHIKPGSDLDLRSEMWLEEADEFGVLYMALVTTTPGSVERFEY